MLARPLADEKHSSVFGSNSVPLWTKCLKSTFQSLNQGNALSTTTIANQRSYLRQGTKPAILGTEEQMSRSEQETPEALIPCSPVRDTLEIGKVQLIPDPSLTFEVRS